MKIDPQRVLKPLQERQVVLDLDGSNEDRPAEGTETYKTVRTHVIAVSSNEDRPAEGTETWRIRDLRLQSGVQMKIDPQRVLKRYHFPASSSRNSRVQMKIDPQRVLKQEVPFLVVDFSRFK